MFSNKCDSRVKTKTAIAYTFTYMPLPDFDDVILCYTETPSPTPDDVKSTPELHRVHLSKVEISPVDTKNAPKYDDEVMENEHDFVEVKPKHVAHAQSSNLEVEQVRYFIVFKLTQLD